MPRCRGKEPSRTHRGARCASAIMKRELAVVSDCSFERTTIDSPNRLDRPLRRPRRSPRPGFPFRWTGFLPPAGAIEDTIWEPDSLEPRRWLGCAPRHMPRSPDTHAFWEAVRRALMRMELRCARGSVLFGPVRM